MGQQARRLTNDLIVYVWQGLQLDYHILNREMKRCRRNVYCVLKQSCMSVRQYVSRWSSIHQ